MNPNAETTNQQFSHECAALLEKVERTWHRRAQVKKIDLDREWIFEEAKEDFPVKLLPFKDHPAFLSVSEAMKSKILSCGWLAYNEKTIDIESLIVSPACHEIIYGKVQGAQNGNMRRIASEILVDEAYHILLTVKVCDITREQRGLQSLRFNNFNLINSMRHHQNLFPESWKKTIVLLATAIVSEVFISEYLSLIPGDSNIQPLNREVVTAHWKDEISHGYIFDKIAGCVYHQLTQEQKEFFVEVLPKPIRWFSSPELDIWKAILNHLGFQKTEEVIADCAVDDEVNLKNLDYSKLIDLAGSLGIMDSQQGIDSFGSEGLLVE